MFNGRKILIIEDDSNMLLGLEDNFRMRGAEVYTADEGKTGLKLAMGKKPDLILLDIMLPEMNGYEICRQLRKNGCVIPIIMLTAKSHEDDLVFGFDLGADDYITKPFRLRELLSRVKAVLRRSGSTDNYFRFSNFNFGIESHQLFKGDKEIKLMPKEYSLLELFLKNPGKALSQESILDDVWGREVTVTTRSVDRCVTTLRSKIEKNPVKPKLIVTVRDVGYRFNNRNDS